MATIKARSIGSKTAASYGTIAIDATGTIITLTPATATVTISIANPAVISWTAHGLTARSVVKFATTGALPTGITAGVEYFVLSTGLAADSFRISATEEGTAIATSGSQSGTHTISVMWAQDWGEGDRIRIFAGSAFSDDFSGDFDTYIDAYVGARLSSTQLLLQANASSGLYASTSAITYTIQRSYSTLAAWFAASPASLIADDSVWKGVAFNDAEYTTNYIGTLTGFDATKCDSTRFHWLTVASGYRHSGIYTTSAVRARMATYNTRFINLNGCPFFMVEWWQVKNEIDSTTPFSNLGGPASDALRIKNCICWGSYGNVNATAIGLYGANSYARNNVVYGNYPTGIHVWGSAVAYNNTVYSAGAVMTKGIYVESTASISKNNIAMTAAGTCFTDNGTASDYNMSSDTSAVGSNSLKSKTALLTFSTITAGSEDLHLRNGSEATDTGTDLSSMFTGDCAGRARSATAWSMGALTWKPQEMIPRSISASSTPKTDGTVAVSHDGMTITLSGSTWDSNWGRGDKITIAGYLVGYVAKKYSNTVLILANSVAGIVCNTSGNTYALERPYTSINTWNTARPASMSTYNRCWEGVVYKDGGDFTERLNLSAGSDDGYDNQRRLWLYAEPSNRHTGTQNTGVRIKPTFVASSGDGNTHVITGSAIHIEGLEFSGENISGTGQWSATMLACNYGSTASYGEGWITGCLFYKYNIWGSSGPGNVVSLGASYRTSHFFNNQIFNCGTSGHQMIGVDVRYSVRIYNNTIIGKYATDSSTGIASNNSSDTIAKNNILMGWADDIAGTWTEEDYNLFSTNDGTGAHDIKSKVTANQFISITAGSENLRLAPGSFAIAAAVQDPDRILNSTGTLTINNAKTITPTTPFTFGDGDTIFIDGEINRINKIGYGGSTPSLFDSTSKTGSGKTFVVVHQSFHDDSRSFLRPQTWDIGAMRYTVVDARSAGTHASYATGTVEVVDPYHLTLTGGTIDTAVWGEGDKIVFCGETNYIASVTDSTHIVLLYPTEELGSGFNYTVSRSYSTLSSWAAAYPVLLTADVVWKGVAYSDSTFNESVTISGATADSTRYMWLTAASGHRHLGAKSGVLIDGQSNRALGISAAVSYTLVQWMRVTGVACQTTYSTAIAIEKAAGAQYVVIDKCYVHDMTLKTGVNEGCGLYGIWDRDSSAGLVISDSIVDNVPAAYYGTVFGLKMSYVGFIYNCIVYRCNTAGTGGTASGLGLGNSGSVVIHNCISCMFSGTPDSSSNGNISIDGSAPAFNNYRINKSAASIWVNPGTDWTLLYPSSPAYRFGAVVA